MLSRAVANREVRWQELTLLAVHFWVKGLRKDLAAFEKGKTCGESATDVGKSAMDVGKSGIIGKMWLGCCTTTKPARSLGKLPRLFIGEG